MMSTAVKGKNMSAKRKKEGMWKQTFDRLKTNKIAMLGLIGIIVMVFISLFGPYFTRYSINDMDLMAIKSGPSMDHLMGTDELGRDYLARLVYGGRYSLGLGLTSSIVSLVVGVVIGSISGYFGGWVDNVIMRLCDIIQSIPATMVSIIISLVMGGGYVTTVVAVALGGVTGGIRMMRGQVLAVRSEEYLEAAKTVNCSTAAIMFKHILPNVMSPMLLGFTGGIGGMIQVAAGLSVIGLGVQPPTPEWGAMLSAGRNYMTSYPHLVIFPGLFIFLTGFFFNIFGDGLRDALDPKLKE